MCYCTCLRCAGTCKELPKEWEEENYGLRFNCPEGEYNDIATLFLSSQHHTIIKLFSVGHNDMDENADDFNPPFSKGALALYTTIYLGLMSVGAGLAIPGGLFMPSILVSLAHTVSYRSRMQLWAYLKTGGVGSQVSFLSIHARSYQTLTKTCANCWRYALMNTLGLC